MKLPLTFEEQVSEICSTPGGMKITGDPLKVHEKRLESSNLIPCVDV